MQQMHMAHQQYDLEQQQAAQQEHYEGHVGHKRESEDPDCECLTSNKSHVPAPEPHGPSNSDRVPSAILVSAGT